ncbi:DUF4097 family beta strand repeat-containing protein [Salinibacterium sp. ZJ454]|uniref:DUF4097 family beta strand repeat-containing protein n=1 Tax=Salinibacterium sp. ZJ454 TaxID=2708339 RepID=UPI001424447C|nr:DUF4097 family beta strand repeat-containing protein [Salinibacterium sp. ZJ454]
MSTQVPAPVQPTPRKSHALRTTLIVIGSVLLLLLIASVIVNIVTALTRTDASGTYEVGESFESIRLDADASDVDVSFADVSEPTITFDQTDSNRAVTFEQGVRGDELRIVANSRGGFFPFGFWPWGVSDSSTIDLVLPEAMNDGSLSLDLTSAAGNMSVDGDFADVTVSLTAGNLDLVGSADVATLESTAGNVRIDDFAATELTVDSTAGDVRVELTELPDELQFSSVAGNQEVVLPDGEYRINTDTVAGNVTIDVPSDPNAERVYHFESVAGDIRILNR